MNYNNYVYHTSPNDERFWVPFLLGGLGGAAAVGISRPRPVFVNRPFQPYPPFPPYGPGYYPRPYGGSYGYSNYNYYY